MTLKLKYFIHLITFDISTLIITAILWIIEPVGILTMIGFVVLMVAVQMIYFLGIKDVLKDLQK